MIILRVEDSNGFGYKEELDSNINNWTDIGIMSLSIKNEDLYFKHRPLPENDNIDIDLITEDHLFGFKNLFDLNDWFFESDLFIGSLFGGKICFYDVPNENVILGGKQLVFDTKFATLICKTPMNYFLGNKNNSYDLQKMIQDAIKYDFEIPSCILNYSFS